MTESKSDFKPLEVLVLAAGLGTRMRSDLAKVLHNLDGRPLINHVCRSATSLAPQKIYIVIGHQGEHVREAVLSELTDAETSFIWQQEQRGTGHAVNSARDELAENDTTLLILSGDVPMIRAETLASMIRHHHAHRGKGAACTILTVKLDEPADYGRIVRSEEGLFERIVEKKDASDAEKEINEINAGIYCFDTKKLFEALKNVNTNNAQGEYYLTDVPALLRESGEDIAIFQHTEHREIEGVNNRSQLADLERIIRKQTITKLMLDHGVTFIDPQSAYISSESKIGRDTVIYPNVSIEGNTEIGNGCIIRSGSRIKNSFIGHGVEILDNCLITDSEIEIACKVGPMAHLRGNAKMEKGSKVGNFVELKNTSLGSSSKASHLSYLGDAEIGENSNIGAGTVTCNYDGKNKHKTKIGDKVRIGSDTMLVAPITIGNNAATGAGSVVTKDVAEGELVMGVPAKSKK